MEFYKIFIMALIEFSAHIVIWCKIGLPWKNNRLKLIALSILITIMVCLTSQLKFRFLASQIIVIASVAIAYKRPLKKTLVEFGTIVICTYLVSVPSVFIVSLFSTSNFNDYTTSMIGLTLYVSTTIILAWLLPLDKWFKKYEYLLEKFIFVIIALLLLSNILTMVRLDSPDLHVIMCLLFLGLIAVIFAFIQSLMEARDQKEMIRAYEQQTTTILPLLDEIRSRQHDFKNHLATIYGFCRQDRDMRSEACEYIEGLNESLRNADSFIHMEDKTIGAILYSKACEASSKDIEFKYELPYTKVEFPLKGYEHAAIISNLIDNAFEAQMNGAEEKKVIFKTGANEAEKFIEVWNNGEPISSKDIHKLFKKGFSTKAENSGHGYGLYTVKKIADQYNAAIEVLAQDSFTVFRVVFTA